MVHGRHNHSTIESISFRFALSNGLCATGVWTKSTWTPKGAPMIVIVNDGGCKGAAQEVWDHYSEVAYRIDHGDQRLVLSVLFKGDDNLYKEDVDSFGYIMHAGRGCAASGTGSSSVDRDYTLSPAAMAPFADRSEEFGFRMQVVSLVAGALESHLFKSITIHKGMRSLNYLLDKPVRSTQMLDMFCRDVYKDFDLSMLKALTEPTTVTESHFVKLSSAKQ